MDLKLPESSEGEGEIIVWLVEDGDIVEAGQPVVEVGLAKVELEIVSPVAGVIKLMAAEGDVVEAEAVIATVTPAAGP